MCSGTQVRDGCLHKLAQGQASQGSSLEWEGGYELSALTEELWSFG